MKLVLASQNQHKLQEMQAILAKFNVEIVLQSQLGLAIDPEETGTTFEENSELKARAVMEACGLPSIADDSGLMVDYLGGAPGVYSARFAGEPCDDDKNNEKLLKLLEGVEEKDRKAKFVSVITMIFPDGETLVVRGECPGRIIKVPVGENGFGYDPIFVPDGFDKSYAQLTDEEKNSISHRAKALEKLEALLKER